MSNISLAISISAFISNPLDETNSPNKAEDKRNTITKRQNRHSKQSTTKNHPKPSPNDKLRKREIKIR
jgi:hypothetical protein